MLKRYLLAGLILAVMFAGCGGGQDGAQRDVTERPGETGMEGETTPGDEAERPPERDVLSTDEAISNMRTIYFAFDKYNLRDDAKRNLEHNAEILKENPGIDIVIGGHCDERGTNEYNLALGERRAKAARDYLVRLGISEERLAVRSYGEERPVAMGHNEEAWAQNRRAEFARR
ncbi:MAG: peptidoglycan-associated lipoprotein Pal [candidate division Zixibacteria bacterium]|nr:peptidoglycan-associated lipoprotein Pal [candidate division Zixibacteria bacterium]